MSTKKLNDYLVRNILMISIQRYFVKFSVQLMTIVLGEYDSVEMNEKKKDEVSIMKFIKMNILRRLGYLVRMEKIRIMS